MTPTQNTLQLTAFTTKDGLFIASKTTRYDGRVPINSNYIVNGKELKSTHHKSWFLLPDEMEITSIEQPVAPKREPDYYTLRDSSLFVEGKIPLNIPYSEVDGYYDCDDDWVWRNHTAIQGLYVLKYKEIAGGLQPVPFEIEYAGEVEGSINKPLETKFKISGKYQSDEVERALKDVVTYSELETVLTPEFLLHEKPCVLPSKQFFNMIRSYVKDNIDRQQARVTSDYDFCFTVSKLIEIKPYEIRSEVLKANGKSYRSPKFTCRQIKTEEITVFEMTSKVDRYNGYPVLEDIKGESLQDLYDNVKVYLETLVEKINTPIKQCECCKGKGYMLNDLKVSTN